MSYAERGSFTAGMFIGYKSVDSHEAGLIYYSRPVHSECLYVYDHGAVYIAIID